MDCSERRGGTFEGASGDWIICGLFARGPDFVSHALLRFVPLMLCAPTTGRYLAQRRLHQQRSPCATLQRFFEPCTVRTAVAALQNGGEEVTRKMIVGHRNIRVAIQSVR